MTDNFKYDKTLIEWRRGIVLNRLAAGKSQTQIAEELKLHPSTISLDVQWIKEKSQEELLTHIQDRIPLEYIKCREGFRKILEIGNSIIDKPNLDDKTRIQCLQFLANTYKAVIELTADGTIIEAALKKIKRLEEQTQVELSEETEVMEKT